MTNMGTFILAGLCIRCILFDLGSTLWRRNKYDWPHLESTADRQAGSIPPLSLKEPWYDLIDRGLGPDHLDMAVTLFHQVQLCQRQKRYEQAEALC